MRIKFRELLDRVTSEVSRLRGFASFTNISLRNVSIEFFKSGTRESLNSSQLILEQTLLKDMLMMSRDFSLLEKIVGIAAR